MSSRCNNDGECNDGSDELDCGNVRKLLQMVEVCKQIILILKNSNTNKFSNFYKLSTVFGRNGNTLEPAQINVEQGQEQRQERK